MSPHADINLRAAMSLLDESGINAFTLDVAIRLVTDALRCANAARDRAMQATCMTVINWLRAAVRRLS